MSMEKTPLLFDITNQLQPTLFIFLALVIVQQRKSLRLRFCHENVFIHDLAIMASSRSLYSLASSPSFLAWSEYGNKH